MMLSGHHDHENQATPPAAAKGQGSGTPLTFLPTRIVRTGLCIEAALRVRESRASKRNVITLGAVRCDDDVGIQPWLATYLI